MPTGHRRRLGVALISVAASVLMALGAPSIAAADPPASLTTCSSAALARSAAGILSEVNAARATAGVPALARNSVMDSVAASWSTKQAAAAKMSHNPDYGRQIPGGWSAAGENVAYGYAAANVTAAWLNSPGHRANILRAGYTHTGIGVSCTAQGAPYYTQVFATYATPPAGQTSAPAPAPPLDPARAGRLAGIDRYATASAISAEVFDAGVPVVFLANGTNFPDALSGGAAAARMAGPVLLVGSDTLPDTVRAELQRLRPARIIVLGGPSVVGDQVVAAAAAFSSTGAERVYGGDRYETSARISALAFEAGASTVFLSDGGNFPDALSGAAAAAADDAALLLVTHRGIPEAIADELARLRPDRIVLLGGDGAISPQVAADAARYTDGTVERLSGTDRYATAAKVSAATFAAGVPVVYLASGTNFPDALAGGAAAAVVAGPVLLTHSGSLPAAVEAELKRLKPKRVVALGGLATVSDAVLRAASTYATG